MIGKQKTVTYLKNVIKHDLYQTERYRCTIYNQYTIHIYTIYQVAYHNYTLIRFLMEI